MNRSELAFERPRELEATGPPESRGLRRDEVRLLVSDSSEDRASGFRELPRWLRPGDLLVVNESATLPAALSAEIPGGKVRLHLSTEYGGGVWLAELRKGVAEPGPVDVAPGDPLWIGSNQAILLAPFPQSPRLWFVRFPGNVARLLERSGEPIRYGYLRGEYDLTTYQTVFARIPGSAEMPSAGRPFSPRVLEELPRHGIHVSSVLLHAAVSSLEVESGRVEAHPMLPEPYLVSHGAVQAIQAARDRGGRVIAVGTTVVRALETAALSGVLLPSRGFTNLQLLPGSPIRVVDGLLTGFHDPYATHLALLAALFGLRRVHSAYTQAIREGYLWHEFGDSQLWLPDPRYPRAS